VSGEAGLLGEAGGSEAQALVAGSLAALAADTPGASVEAHGSLSVRRLILNGGRSSDAVALADPSLFDGIAPRVRLFATNALVVTYNPDSDHADAIRRDWSTAFRREDCRVGRTDPEDDPLGYRTVLALRLAERRGIASTDLLDQTQLLRETGLMQNVEVGKLDAAFAYRSMAHEHDLPVVELPAAIDFSDPTRADEYASVSMDLPGGTVRGGPIRYGAAALTDDGEDWVEDLVSDRGRLRDHGFAVPDEYPVESDVGPFESSD
jgi:molybdate/tungstate transport system substrate-binding protein